MKRRSLWLIAIATLMLLTAIPPVYSSEVIVGTFEEDQISPAIAFNTDTDDFLVVWDDYVWRSIGTLGIAAQRVGQNGSLVGESFAVVGEWFASRPFQHPQLVYNPSTHEYLLVWEYGHADNDHHIYARRLPSTVKAPEDAIGSDHIHIAHTSSYESNPRVAYNPTDNEYLIVWEHRNVQSVTTGSGSIDIIQNDIYGQRLSSSGSLLGGPIGIATTSMDQSSPAVAFGGTQGTYLIVWQDTQATGETDIYGQRIGATGTLIGGTIAISTWQYNQVKPRLAYNTKKDEFLVVWEDHHWGWGDARDIYAQRVNGSGILQGANFAVSWEGEDLRLNPDIAYNPKANEYLVACEYEEYYGDSHIYQRRLSSDGTLIGDEVMVSNQSTSQAHPAIASADTSCLIVWEDGRNVRTMATDLYGAVIHLDIITGHVYEGYMGDESSPLSNVAIDLYCSNNASQVGSLLGEATTDVTGSYTLMLDQVCEYYNIIENDPTGYISTGASSAGRVINDNWIELTYPLSSTEMRDNNFWDSTESPPGNWTAFSPTDWVTSQSVTCTVKVTDTGSGLDVSTAQYAYTTDTSWSAWQAASCTGTGGTTSPQTVTAPNVPFGRDSTTIHPHRIKFRIADMSGSSAESPAFNVNIDTTPPTNPTLSADRDTGTWSEDATITITWSGASDASSGIEKYFYKWSNSSTTVPDETLSTTALSLSTTIPAEGDNSYFHLITVDSAGNGAATAVHMGPFYLDTGPPEITSGPTVSSLTQYSVVVSWQTSEEADSTVKYSNTPGAYTLQETDATLVTDHSISLTNLSPSTTYRLMVQSTDASGKKTESHEITFETLALTDTTNPTVFLLDPGVCRGTVTISANASDDKGVECVVFSFDNDIIGIDYTPPYQIIMNTEQLLNKDYIITAKAIDFSGRSSIDAMKKPIDNLKDYMDPTVKITSPKDKETVSGKVDVIADLSDDTGIVSARFYVNGDYKKYKKYDVTNPPTTAEVTFTWDTRGLDDDKDEYDIAIEVFDTEGHLNAHAISVNVVKEPPPAPPQIPQLKVTGHKATRIQNYFSIQLTVKNFGDQEATNVRISDGLKGFQAIDKDITGHASFLSHWEGKYNYCEISPKLSIPKGETGTYTYYAVPVLIYPDPPDPEIGDVVCVEWSSPSSPTDSQPYSSCVMDMPAILQGNIENTISGAHKQAVKMCDYLIVTNHKRLFSHNTNDNDVNTLLSDMARLAKKREGVLGYMDNYDRNLLRNLIKPYPDPELYGCKQNGVDCDDDWWRMLSDKFRSTLGGYLLIVGETEIFPSWPASGFGVEWSSGGTTNDVHLTDQPYADITGGGTDIPNIIVGRLIGDKATILSKAIQSSIDGNAFDRSDALLVSGTGDGQDDFVENVNDINNILKGKNFSVDVLHWKDTKIPSGAATGTTIDDQRLQEFRDSCDDGQDVIYFRDHGGADCWCPALYTTNFRVDFGSTNPFAFASACSTGNYEAGDDDNIAENFLDSGAAVYIGSTEKSPRTVNSQAGEWFFNNWDADEDIGTVFTQLERDKWTSVLGKHKYWTLWIWEYNLYGDPKFGKLTTTNEQKEKVVEKRQTPTPSIDVEIPDYEVSSRDNLDYVEIPNGKLWLEEGKYQVPYFSISLDYPQGYRVQAVSLTNRSGLMTDTGLHLPITIMDWGGPGSNEQRNSIKPQGWFPALDKCYEWRLIENPDNTTTLVIIMYPFYYNGQSTDVQFYKHYSFTIDYISSTVEITSLITDKHSYPQGNPVQIQVGVNNTGEAKDIVVSMILKPSVSDTMVDSLPLSTLSDLSGYATFSDQWDSTGFSQGYYAVEVTIKDTSGNVLDTKADMFRLGISSGKVVSLTALPASFDPGDTIALSMNFKNTGTIPITGTAIMKVKDQSGNTVKQFSHPVTNLTAANSIAIDDTWDTTNVPGALYAILGYVLFDSKSSDVMTTTVSCLYDGDVAPLGNRDGIVNVGDALVCLRFALGLETPTQEDMGHGDVAPLDTENKPNPDGLINVGDALVILRKALGLISF